MKRSLFLFSCLLLMSGVVVAQPLSFGVKAGVSFPWQTIKMGEESIAKDKSIMVGFHAGGLLLLQMPLPGLEVEADVLFSSKGVSYKTDKSVLNTEAFDYTSTLYYLDIPLKVNYSIGLAKTGIFLGAGPTFSIALAGNSKVGEAKEKIEFGSDLGKANRFDLGAGLQAGVRIAGFQVSGYFDWFFLNVSNAEKTKIQNRVGGVSLAYLF